ncbi:hypothetical protein EV191_1011297 [Tamaricihabitans halophyticus]|uniref:YCII-related domain-containing protein n=1 Tax=Tamaricihabitans halophyticus TaxID=1262583 RepID=A0A4R2R3E3_9PSEU|nr:YciI family protein [Tamaricihabitans halophyticus]TCP57342.1 hypothetical protein EV191_1011297 [Tamaricihabitans halophyticus]
MAKYMGLARDAHDWSAMSEDELGEVMQQYVKWSEELQATGKAIAGGQLGDEVKVLRGGMAATDGPYAESSELLGGVAIIEADSLAEAVEVFSTHPNLAFGSIEVREYIEL